MSEGSLSPEQHAREVEEASKTFDIVRASANTLLLDLDTDAAIEQYGRVLVKLRDHFGVSSVETWPSKSGNTHVLITLSEPLPVTVRVALQAALGSDGVRELLCLKRIENGAVEPSVLFKPKKDN